MDIDQSGQPIPDNVRSIGARPRRSRAGSSRAGMGSIGTSVWEMLHPEQVQAEYRAMGQEPPSVLAIETRSALEYDASLLTGGPIRDAGEYYYQQGAHAAQVADDAVNAAIDAGGEAVAAVGQLGKWVVLGLVALAVLSATKQFGRD